ncbi:MerR family transcriptional regulator [uncultured Duncaniella sp.]|uniref:MerR family transcriptional regulator n=1 Tax=uncultured Duncaniella sp. TaxID=2768039 RepID=UPI0025EBB569|nr:MerR family transcriptional regulator [uncultured Duncaniella sp.]
MDITSKKYYKISEVSEMLGLPMSTLRFWENHFPAINPRRNDRGTRFYTPRDIEVIRMIAYLVKDKGMKLEAAQEELRRNRDGVVKKFETVEKLKKIRATLQEMLDSLHKLR